jgi:ABC-type multidrug transport system ATPase subunit
MLDPNLVILDEPSMGLSPKVLKSVFDAVRMMNKQGKTILLVEQNARAGLRLSTHGVVLENGRVRLAGSGHEVLHHPEIGALYLGGAVTDSSGTASPAAEGVDAAAAQIAAADADAMSAGSGRTDSAANGTAANGTAAR